MDELRIAVAPFGDEETIVGNIRYSLSLGLPELQIAPCAHDGTFCIVGSSPSLPTQVDAIRAEQDRGRAICAINGGHDFLMAHGITPDLFITVDPRPMPHNFKHLNKTTVYLISSRCSPETFDTLKEQDLMIWHSWSDNFEQEEIKEKMAIGGGTTSGMRAINVAYVLGYRSVHLYGMDSCLNDKREKRWDSDSLFLETQTTDVICGDKSFICNMAMAQQAQDFQGVYDVMGDIHIEVFGGGLLAAILEEREKQGMKV